MPAFLKYLLILLQVSLATGGTISALFGMNLIHSFEEHELGFLVAAGGVVCVSSSTFGLIYFLTRQRLGHVIGPSGRWTKHALNKP